MHRAALLLAACALASAWTPPPVAVDDKLVLWACDGGASGRQQFDIGNSSSSPTAISIRGGSLVWDIIGPSNDTGTGIHAWGYYSDNQPNQNWATSFSSPSTLSPIRSLWGKCLGTEGPAMAGARVVLVDCEPGSPAQSFLFDNSTGVLTLRAAPGQNVTSLCVDAGASANCTQAPFNTYDYCNPDLAPDVRAADLAGRLNAYDWASLLNNNNVGLARFGIPQVAFNEALHGIVFGCGPTYTDNATGYVSTGCPTSFPHATVLGSSFNRSLWRAVATTISDEGRALHNSNGYALMTWAPDINCFRDPRWGRGQEVTGEDPVLMAEYIYEYARGMQEGEDPRYIKLVSTAKHFSGYDLENWGGYDRNSFTASISLHDAVEYFWPPFESATMRGHVHSMMCSYNSVALDGAPEIPSCAWSWLQNDVARGEWGWDGCK